MILCVPAASAAPPANDDFADREVLAGSLPIEVARSNVDATKEVGEPAAGIFAAGHSVWFEWQAEITGLVTIGTCDSAFDTVLGVFTGTAVDSLTRVVEGNDSEGPHCPYSQQQYTFEATSGTSYKIAVDGNGFYLPDAPKPVTEGSISLRIEARSPPTNDDFHNAAALEGEITEEPGGDRFYYASAFGHNWGATKEPGEPDHAGDLGGASVWFSWIAPASGVARIGPCCSRSLFGVYIGNVVDGLTAIEPTSDPPLGSSFPVSAGTTYRIAVDGEFDAGKSAAWMGSFSLSASMELPPGPGASQAVSPVAEPLAPLDPPPDTTIVGRSSKPTKRRAAFAFRSTEPGSAFLCKLDQRPFASCASPKAYKGLRPGWHRFEVAAVDTVGNVDSSPAVARFKIPKPRGQRKD